ncbi:MAG: Bug family tripartite tricarboxylate transporter substrate binding protein [Lautropia sp.]
MMRMNPDRPLPPAARPADIRRRRMIAAGGAALAAIARPGQAQAAYPARPIRLIVPFAPGGAGDVSARVIADRFGQRFGSPVIVENRPGAGGNIGAQAAAAAEPDGYTLLLGFDGTLVINPHVYSKVPFDSLQDFVPIGKIGDIGLLIVAHPGLEARDLAGAIALSKARRGGLAVGSGGQGTTAHLLIELLKQRTGADLVHVPYKGAGPALVGVMGGETPLAVVGVIGVAQHVASGAVRALAFSSTQRAPGLPDVPTIGESGVSGLAVNSWNGLLAPARTPRPVIELLARELNAALADAGVRERLAKLGYASGATSPEAFGAEIRAAFDEYGRVVKTAGIRAD